MPRVTIRRKELSYAQIPATSSSPPVSITPRVQSLPVHLWKSLPPERQHRVLCVLSRLISHQLPPSGRKEVPDEEQ
jgi:hypothetical protein